MRRDMCGGASSKNCLHKFLIGKRTIQQLLDVRCEILNWRRAASSECINNSEVFFLSSRCAVFCHRFVSKHRYRRSSSSVNRDEERRCWMERRKIGCLLTADGARIFNPLCLMLHSAENSRAANLMRLIDCYLAILSRTTVKFTAQKLHETIQ